MWRAARKIHPKRATARSSGLGVTAPSTHWPPDPTDAPSRMRLRQYHFHYHYHRSPLVGVRVSVSVRVAVPSRARRLLGHFSTVADGEIDVEVDADAAHTHDVIEPTPIPMDVPPPPPPPPPPRVNLMKLLSRAGVASRRSSLALIESGRVTVDGRRLTPKESYHIAHTARVAIDGRPFLEQHNETTTNAQTRTHVHSDTHPPTTMSEEPHTASDRQSTAAGIPLRVPSYMPTPKLWLYHKPVGLLVSHKDNRFNRPTVFDRIAQDYLMGDEASSPSSSSQAASHCVSHAATRIDRLLSVGRLDYLSEGLLLLTNTGSIQQYLEHPSSHVTRTYRIRIRAPLGEEQIRQLKEGINIDGFQFQPVDVQQLAQSRAGVWYQLRVTEGKNRELRTLMNYFDRAIDKLVRIGYDEWTLNPLQQHSPLPSSSSGQLPRRPVPAILIPQSAYDLAPGEMVEVPWTKEMERKRIKWVEQRQQKEREEKKKQSTQAEAELEVPPPKVSMSSSPSLPVAPSRQPISPDIEEPLRRPTENTNISFSHTSSEHPPTRSPHSRAPHKRTTTTTYTPITTGSTGSRWMHTTTASFSIARRSFSSIVPNPFSSSLSSPSPTASVSVGVPPRAAPRVYPEDSGFYILTEPKEAAKSKKGKSNKDPLAKRAALQRGAPPPRPLPPKPNCIKDIDRPWMQDTLHLKIATASEGGSVVELKIHQWTGMKFPEEIAAAAASSPSSCTSIPPPPPSADVDAGSGTIVWDSALHLVEYLVSSRWRPAGAVLEIGAGTGVLGLAIEKLFPDTPILLTDSGPVTQLMRANVAENQGKAQVHTLRWDQTNAFIAETLSSSSSSPSSSQSLPIRTILCSEVLDTIPSDANPDAFGVAALTTLVDAIASLARHSIDEQEKHAAPASSDRPSCEVFFAFEQRGLLRLTGGDGHMGGAASAPPQLLDRHLVDQWRQVGFEIERIYTKDVFRAEADLTLFRLTITNTNTKPHTPTIDAHIQTKN